MRACILAFAVAIALLQTQEALPGTATLAILAALAVVATALAACGPSVLQRACALLASALAGFLWAAFLASTRLADQLPPDWEVRDIELVGVVASLPQRSERGERFEFEVEEVRTPLAIVPRRIMLSWYRAWDEVEEGSETVDAERAKPVRPGERWRFTARLKRPHGQANPYAYDYEGWLFERNIRATGTIRAAAANARLQDFVWRPAYVVERCRDAIRARFLGTLPEAPYLGVLIALAVGDQRAIPMEMNN